MDDFDVMHLPPNYTDADRAARDEVSEKLNELQREYQDLCAPLVKQLTDIDARYAPRVVLIPALSPLEAD